MGVLICHLMRLQSDRRVFPVAKVKWRFVCSIDELVMAAASKQYAVVEVRWAERPSERFVIAYPDEETLRDVIAGPNILACGFASFLDAEAYIDASLIAARPRSQPKSVHAATRDDR